MKYAASFGGQKYAAESAAGLGNMLPILLGLDRNAMVYMIGGSLSQDQQVAAIIAGTGTTISGYTPVDWLAYGGATEYTVFIFATVPVPTVQPQACPAADSTSDATSDGLLTRVADYARSYPAAAATYAVGPALLLTLLRG